MKMKLTAAVAAALSALTSFLTPYGAPFVVGLTFAFLVYGVVKSSGRGIDPLNDVPNALRVFLACLAGYLLALKGFLPASAAVLLFAGSVLLNDEYQRRTLRSVALRRRGGTVALLGIDGSGKSTHSAELEAWFRARGYYCERVPFHRYLFVERLASKRKGDSAALGGRRGGNPFRPLLSAVDNLLLYLITSLGRGTEGRVVLYDRFIWSTFVKYKALGYPVRLARPLFLLPRPTFAVVLDIPVERSLGVIGSRPDHIRYRAEVLGEERDEYLAIARRRGFPVVDSTRDYGVVQREIEAKLSPIFPAVGGAAA